MNQGGNSARTGTADPPPSRAVDPFDERFDTERHADGDEVSLAKPNKVADDLGVHPGQTDKARQAAT
jgi:hypothetical protein